jgi:hypothetical protein
MGHAIRLAPEHIGQLFQCPNLGTCSTVKILDGCYCEYRGTTEVTKDHFLMYLGTRIMRNGNYKDGVYYTFLTGEVTVAVASYMFSSNNGHLAR